MISPLFIYGTAWKKEKTRDLVSKALSSGFRAIDTANQAKHYHEVGVGDALKEQYKKMNRGDLFIQTKFTPVDGQDHRLPYDPDAPVAEQVEQSFQSSLQHLHTDYIDSYLLHGPYSHPGLIKEDWDVWGAMEKIYRSGKAKSIGISNVNIHQLQELIEKSEIKPMSVQNRCYASLGWDRQVRELCKKNEIVYQGFSLLTANSPVLHHPPVQAIAGRLNLKPTQLIFLFSHQIGMTPLTGTSDETHMKEDLASLQFKLTKEELQFIEQVAG